MSLLNLSYFGVGNSRYFGAYATPFLKQLKEFRGTDELNVKLRGPFFRYEDLPYWVRA